MPIKVADVFDVTNPATQAFSQILPSPNLLIFNTALGSQRGNQYTSFATACAVAKAFSGPAIIHIAGTCTIPTGTYDPGQNWSLEIEPGAVVTLADGVTFVKPPTGIRGTDGTFPGQLKSLATSVAPFVASFTPFSALTCTVENMSLYAAPGASFFSGFDYLVFASCSLYGNASGAATAPIADGSAQLILTKSINGLAGGIYSESPYPVVKGTVLRVSQGIFVDLNVLADVSGSGWAVYIDAISTINTTQVYSVGPIVIHPLTDASRVTYSPTTPGNWTTVPTLVSGALDTLAANVTAGAGIVQKFTRTYSLFNIHGFGTTGGPFTILVGVLPANARVLASEVSVDTAFTHAGLTAGTIQLEGADPAGSLVASGDLTTAGLYGGGNNPYPSRGSTGVNITVQLTGSTFNVLTTAGLTVNIFYAVLA